MRQARFDVQTTKGVIKLSSKILDQFHTFNVQNFLSYCDFKVR